MIMININVYFTAYYLKKDQIYIVYLRNLQYQAKKVKVKVNPKSIILQKYHNFLDLFP